MLLHTSVGPNPHVVTMLLKEKGVELPSETVDIMAGVNRQADFLKVNPRGTSPALVLDSGEVISEITAICEFIEEMHPDTPLIGSSPEQRAETRMWVRRIDLGFCEPGANGFRFAEGLQLFESRMRCLPEASDGLKAVAQDFLKWLDGALAGKQYICGDRFSLADIMLYCFMTFAAKVGQAIDPANANVAAWYERMDGRDTTEA
jgi:glutathione S-transferase